MCAGECGGDWVVGEWGVCNGEGAIYECGCADIPEGDCDCDENVLDECDVCGGTGVDEDEDGICDDVDDCVGEYDECDVCNGDGIADGACDCDGNVEDCAGDCGGDAVVDECGVCNGENADQDCNCDCFGDAYTDECGTCDDDASTDCT